MRQELINSIENLQTNIEQLEHDYKFNLYKNAPKSLLSSIRIKIGRLKNELIQMELQLLDELPSKRKGV